MNDSKATYRDIADQRFREMSNCDLAECVDALRVISARYDSDKACLEEAARRLRGL